MLESKYEFIERYIFPVLKPIEDFFGKYGIHKVTVTVVPALIIVLIAIKGELRSKSKLLLIAYISAAIILLIVFVKFQFFEDD